MDKKLEKLIEHARHPSISLSKKKIALNQLLFYVQNLPGLLQDSHPDYGLAYNRTLEWFCRNLSKFEERPPSLEQSLVVWINSHLNLQIRSLYVREQGRIIQQESVDAFIGTDGNMTTHLEMIADPTPSLSTLDTYIEALQEVESQYLVQDIKRYIEQDLDGCLADCSPRRSKQCNCQLLAMRLVLKKHPDRIADLAREFGVNNQTLYSHWKQKCIPLLRELAIALQLRYEPFC